MYEYKALINRVIDGDTVDIDIDLGFGIWMKDERVRVMGIDTPELRTRNKKEKKFGYEVRDYLREKILNKVVTLECGEFDKYGRLLIKIKCYGEECSINQWLINNDYAFEYNGGTKQCWEDYLEKKISKSN